MLVKHLYCMGLRRSNENDARKCVHCRISIGSVVAECLTQNFRRQDTGQANQDVVEGGQLVSVEWHSGTVTLLNRAAKIP